MPGIWVVGAVPRSSRTVAVRRAHLVTVDLPAFPGLQNYLKRLAEAMNTTAQPSFDALMGLVVIVVIVAVTAFFTLIPSWRGGQVPAARAISTGFAPPRTNSSRLAAAVAGLGISPAIAVGLTDVFARP